MKKILLPLFIAAGFANALADEPIITIRSNAFAEIGESNQFSILLGATESTYVDVDCGAGSNEYELKYASVNTSTGEFEGTWIPLRVNESGEVKIYGDASKIDVIVAEGGYITDIDMDRCTNLEVINLQHNSLRHLDLTPFSKAYAIYLTDNPFTEATPLVIGTPKPDLQILEVDIVDHIDPGFNLSDYPAMVSFDAYHNRGLKRLDPTGCPNLLTLSVELTDVETLDVSRNTKLMRLNIAESRITEIDLSHNTALQHFLANHDSGVINCDVRLRGIDLTKNTALTLLNLNGNNLGTVDLTKNIALTNLSLRRNALTALNLESNTELYSLDVKDNNLDFATLPLPRNTFGEYFYKQLPLETAKSHVVGSTIDLSKHVLRENTTTTATLWRSPINGDPVKLDDSYFTYADGRVTLLKAIADSVYVSYENDVFAEYPLVTTPFKVKTSEEFGKPTRIVGLTMAAAPEIEFTATVAGPTGKLLVEFGGAEGGPLEFAAGTVKTATPAGFNGSLSILMPEGEVLTGFAIAGTELYDANFSAATELRTLSITGCGLYTIDLANNRCLTEIDLSGNNLSMLNLKGVYGSYEKTTLTTLKAANNRLTQVNIPMNRQIVNLDLSGNKLSEFDFTNYMSLRKVDLGNNAIEGDLSLTYLIEADSIELRGNKITSLRIDKFSHLKYLGLSENPLTFATLPLPGDVKAENYVYSPLPPIALQEKAPAINLSDQDLDNATTFVWKTADGVTLTQGSDIDCNRGATKFLRTDIGKVLCEMTNPAFPDLTLTTTEVLPIAPPTNVIATLTPSAAASATASIILTASKPGAIYIDWQGDGTEYVEYPLQTSYTEFPLQPVTGKQAKVYTYGSADELTVFSLAGLPLSQIDVEKLTGLVSLNITTEGLNPENIKMPQADGLRELTLGGCGLSSYPYADRYPALTYLCLPGNSFRTFDASVLPQIETLILSSNLLKTVKFNNPRLWNLHLDNNALENVNLNGLPAVTQLLLNSNYLSEIDLQPVKSTLQCLSLVLNSFTFATLPLPGEYPAMSVYYYGRQDPVEVTCTDGVVDLSSQAMAGTTATTYEWFLGEAYLDAESGLYTGEKLVEGTEYKIEGGVTTFLREIDEQVQCVMSNTEFPNLQLTTKRISVDKASIEEISAPDATTPRGTFDLQGRRVAKPARGIYIIDGRKTFVK